MIEAISLWISSLSLRRPSLVLRVDDASLSVAEILAGGPGAHFLDREHTIANLREIWQPGLAYQWSSEENAFRDPREVASERVRDLLERHVPAAPEDRVCEELKMIIRSAESEILKD